MERAHHSVISDTYAPCRGSDIIAKPGWYIPRCYLSTLVSLAEGFGSTSSGRRGDSQWRIEMPAPAGVALHPPRTTKSRQLLTSLQEFVDRLFADASIVPRPCTSSFPIPDQRNGCLYLVEWNCGMERWNEINSGMKWGNDHAHRMRSLTTYTHYVWGDWRMVAGGLILYLFCGLVFLLVLAFLIFTGYLHYVHWKYSHIPQPKRSRWLAMHLPP